MRDVAKNTNGSGGSGCGLPRPESMENRLCIKIPEAAAMLGISRNFAYELVRQHKLPVIEFGKRKLIPKAQLIKLLEQQKDNA
jgi:excisionase family DNA binding protein